VGAVWKNRPRPSSLLMRIDKNDNPLVSGTKEAGFLVTWSKHDINHGIVAEL
jgi:hypothetical protein